MSRKEIHEEGRKLLLEFQQVHQWVLASMVIALAAFTANAVNLLLLLTGGGMSFLNSALLAGFTIASTRNVETLKDRQVRRLRRLAELSKLNEETK